jgi:MurNAc alpha-1-phosphate uridylyltransferase
MVLAAGRGERMRPLTDRLPKPLIRVAGKPLIDHVLDRLAQAHVETAVVNVHHCADLLERHLAGRRVPRVRISDERGTLLGTGGGIVKALPWLGSAPFFMANSDSIWIEGVTPNLNRLRAAFDPARMDALLLLAATATSIGYDGPGDFALAPDGRLHPRVERQIVPFVYAGVALLAPALFAAAPSGGFFLNSSFERAARAGRLHGVRLDGLWMHVGTPEAVGQAEAAIVASAA